MKILSPVTLLFFAAITNSFPCESTNAYAETASAGLPAVAGSTLNSPDTKENKQARKNANAMRRIHEKSYRLTKISKQRKQKNLKATSQELWARDFKVLGKQGRIKYYVASEFGMQPSDSTSTIIIDTISSETVEGTSTALPSSPRRTGGGSKKQWHGFSAYYFKRNEVIRLKSMLDEQRKKRAQFGSRERIEVQLQTKELFRPIRFGSGLTITLHSDLSDDMTLEIPFAFLTGYFAKLAETGALTEKQATLSKRIGQAIQAQSSD